ncbi:hypothetical protein PROFUN_08095 [Planoprotostelium fungivorum]|uniref:Uncharacterized protein n=1 Tax=Planoprotostelium fungivorum TaxID=1890364 RepID=A0A2P6NKC9_9EUKA|nr:hypothetical protein PROFUN_08095 [Planoprotostelium fungivorum]
MRAVFSRLGLSGKASTTAEAKREGVTIEEDPCDGCLLLSLPLDLLLLILDVESEVAWLASGTCTTMYQMVVSYNLARDRWLQVRNLKRYLEKMRRLLPWPRISISIDGISAMFGNTRALQQLYHEKWENLRGLKIDFSQHSKQPLNFLQNMDSLEHLTLLNLHEPDRVRPIHLHSSHIQTLPLITLNQSRLKSLQLECSRTSSIFNTEWKMHMAPLADLSCLTELNISYTEVPDLWAIRRLPLVRLTLSLYFTWHEFDDEYLRPVAEIETLQSFLLDGGMSQTGVEILGGLKNLRQIHFWPGPKELDLEPLLKLPQLTEITLVDQVHLYINTLAKMPNLRRITLLWISRPISLEKLVTLEHLEVIWVTPALWSTSESIENMVICRSFSRMKKRTKIIVDGVLVSGDRE